MRGQREKDLTAKYTRMVENLVVPSPRTKQPVAQKLTDDHIKSRLAAANRFHELLIESKAADSNNILFTDECVLGVGAEANRQNDRYWQVKGEFDPYSVIEERSFQGEKMKTHIFVGVHSRAEVIGPIFLG